MDGGRGGQGALQVLQPNPLPRNRQYRLLSHQEPSVFLAIRGLERSHPEASLRVTGSSGLGFFLRPLDEKTAFWLSHVAREPEQFGITLEEVAAKARGVVLRYPVGFSLDPLLADPRVAFARRCTYSVGHGRREPTRQVLVTFRDALPNSLDLGSWGVYSVRRYIPEPLRCFKCQAFGHVQKHCGARELCAVCSGRHPTSECISALQCGERRAARCPNCGKGHHAWSRLCPERLRRLPPSSKDGRPGHKENSDARPLSAAPREGSHEVCQRSKALASPAQTTTAANSTPALPSLKRRRKRSKAKVASREQATTTIPEAPKPTTAEASVQTDTLPPPPQTKDAEVDVFPETFNCRVQAVPPTCDCGVQTDEQDEEQDEMPTEMDITEEELEAAARLVELPPAIIEAKKTIIIPEHIEQDYRRHQARENILAQRAQQPPRQEPSPQKKRPGRRQR